MSPHPQWDEDFYKLLGVNRSANLSEIASAYHQAKNAYSKESLATYSLFTPEENQETLAKLEKAYLTLSNIDKKRDYDRWLDGGAIGPTKGTEPVHESGLPYSSQPTDMPTFFQNAVRPAPVEAPRRAPSNFAVASQPAPAPSPHLSVAIAPEPETDTIETVSPTSVTLMDGPHLKLIREKLGLTADDVCRITKIPSRYLKAIEAAQLNALPARVYLQGFVKNLAKLYHLDPKATVEAYLLTVPPTTPSP